MSILSKIMCWIMAVTLVCVGQMAYGDGVPTDLAASVRPDQGGDVRDLVTIATGVDATEQGYLRISPDDMGSWSSTGFGGGGDVFNPNGFATGMEATFTSGVFLFVGSTRRELLSENPSWQDGLGFSGDTSMSTTIISHNLASDTNGDTVDDTLMSSFEVTGGVTLNIDLTQQVYTIGGVGSGISELEQVFAIENKSGIPVDIVLVSTFDGDLVWVGDFTDDSVGTEANAGGTKQSAFEQEAGAPATRIEVRSPDASDYYGGRNGIDPDAGGVPYGFGTDSQIWDAYGVPDGSGGADASDWRNHIAGVGYNTDGESGAAPAGCGTPCDGFVGVQIPVFISTGGVAIVTIYHTYGAPKLCGNGVLDPNEQCDPPDGQCCDDECQFVAPGAACGDGSDTDCDDPDTCDGSGNCNANNEPNGTPCEDGDVCTEGDACKNGVCAGGAPVPACQGDLEPPCKCCKDAATAGLPDCDRYCGAEVAEGDQVYSFSGEFYESVVDLRIPGRGPDFGWARKYRSKIDPNTVQGNGWDCSYNIRIEQVGEDLTLLDGNTRQDTYSPQPDGSWATIGFFRVITQNPDDSYTLAFEDTGQWNFNAFDGTPPEGKIASIEDRNTNKLTFTYDDQGNLTTATDTLDRDITIAYNDDGFIESVTDYTGRQVLYEYYQDGDAGGSFGDLRSTRTSTVTGTPNGNDFPEGKTTVYTYSKGLEYERLNHNLLTITDPKGQLYLTNVYSTEDPGDLNFDRVVRQNWGKQATKRDPGDIIDFVYVPVTPMADNNFAVIKTIVNDRVGNVSEHFFDIGNRGVIVREYTGRWDPDQPTTEADLMNPPPTPKLRPGDPDFFETRWEYNADSLPTRVIHPNLNEEVFIYDEANAEPRSQGNLLQRCRLPGPLGSDDQPDMICESYEYDDGFGGCCGTNFVTRHVDGRGNETLHDYDDFGNRTHTTHRIPTIVEDFEYNEFGQITSHTLPDNGSNHRRRDEYTYYDSGIQLGYRKDETIDAPNFALTTTYEYDSLGRVTRQTDPRDHDTQYTYNELDQVVRQVSREVAEGGGVRYERDTFYDANDNVVRMDIQNKDDQGVLQPNTHFTNVYEYEILNYTTRICEEVGDYTDPIPGPTNLPTCDGLPQDDFLGTEYEYDANRNRTLLRHGEAVEGRQLTNVSETRYDERDLTFQDIRAPGDADQSTTQYDHDKNRNMALVSQGIEDVAAPRITVNTYDGYDRLVTSTDPMGNVMTYHYDENHSRVSHRSDGELVDVEAGAANVRLSEGTYVYDEMDRLILTEVEFFDTETQTPIEIPEVPTPGKATTVTDYSDNSQVLDLVNDNNHQTATTYDTANRRSVVTDHLNNTMTYAYDANSNVTSTTEVEKSDLGNPDETFTTTYQYDNLDRLIKTVDNGQNTTEFGYDSRDNHTVTVDALRPDNPTDPGNVTRYCYDGINRLITTTRFLTDDGTGPGNPAGTIVTTQSWDDTSRLIEQADDNGNATTYVYDSLNRMTAEQYADGTVHAYTYDVHYNGRTMLDANGNDSIWAYDLLDRLTAKTVVPGPGISKDTTFEILKYDGLSRLVRAEDDDSVVTRSYDSLSRVTRETLNTQTTTCLYDGVGNALMSTYPGGRVIEWAYDELERPETIEDTTAGTQTIAQYDYMGPGRVERREYGNAARTDYTYDGITGIPNPPNDFGVKRIIRTTHSLIADGTIIDDRTYTWDRMFNKTQRADVRTDGPQLTHDYDYDSIYRLIHTVVTDVDSTVLRDTTYDLDGVGNRELISGDNCPGPYTLDDSLPEPADFQMNQYTKTPLDCRTHDRNGNLIRTSTTPTGVFGDIVEPFCPPDCPQPALDDILCLLDDFIDGSTVDGCGDNEPPESTDLQPCAGGDGMIGLDDIMFMLDAFAQAFPCPSACPQAPDGCPARDRTIFYDYRNQMVEHTDVETGITTTYAYDPFGRRIARVIDADGIAGGPTETRYFYDGWQVVEEQDGIGTTEATYVYGLYIDEVLNMQRDTEGDATPEDYYYHTDDLYNVMAITDAAGAVVERYEYADYGQPLDPITLAPMSGNPSGIGNPYFFTGRRYDPETGWYYFRTRYLDPIAGRFTTRDTIGLWGDDLALGNGYTYVGNNPGSDTDEVGEGKKQRKLRKAARKARKAAKKLRKAKRKRAQAAEAAAQGKFRKAARKIRKAEKKEYKAEIKTVKSKRAAQQSSVQGGVAAIGVKTSSGGCVLKVKWSLSGRLTFARFASFKLCVKPLLGFSSDICNYYATVAGSIPGSQFSWTSASAAPSLSVYCSGCLPQSYRVVVWGVNASIEDERVGGATVRMPK